MWTRIHCDLRTHHAVSSATPLAISRMSSDSTHPSRRSHDLRPLLQAALEAVLDSTTLVRLELSCALVVNGPVTATKARAGEGALFLRFLAVPGTDRLPPSALLVVATDETALVQSRSLPALLSQLLDAHLARLSAEATAVGAMEIANRDPATGLGNRRAWMQSMGVESARAVRSQRPLTLFILDIDGLKAINDRLGHAAGDQHIARTAEALIRAARTTDQVCRLGGDEFGIAAPDTDELQARQLAVRLRSSLGREGLQVSIGWAASTDEASFADLWQRADASMYQDKRTRQREDSTSRGPT